MYRTMPIYRLYRWQLAYGRAGGQPNVPMPEKPQQGQFGPKPYY